MTIDILEQVRYEQGIEYPRKAQNLSDTLNHYSTIIHKGGNNNIHSIRP